MARTADQIDPETRRSVRMCMDRISGDYSIAGAYLYGSRARGDHRADSDADVALILNGPKRRTSEVAAEMAATEFDVMLETGILVSAFPVWMEDWRDPSRHGNPWLIANIKRDGIAL